MRVSRICSVAGMAKCLLHWIKHAGFVRARTNAPDMGTIFE